MNPLAWLSDTSLGYAQVVVAALGTVLSIGVAFLARPGRATLLWACAFTLAMVSMFGVLTGELNDIEDWRRVALGMLLGVPALLWSGFRAWSGRRDFAWAGPALAVLAALALVFSPDEGFVVVYRVAFLVSAVFAGLLFVEWVRGPLRRDPFAIPLGVLSLAFLLLAVVGAFAPVSSVRPVSAIGMIAYTAAAILAVVGLSLRGTRFVLRRVDTSEIWDRFTTRSEARLREAQSIGETWSVLYFRLDDAEDVRRAGGTTLVSTLETRFEAAIVGVFHDDADVSSPDRGAMVVLTSQSDAAVRELLRTALGRVTSIDPEGRAPIRPSASAGWAPASGFGYDFVSLVYLAREAAELATQRGGDRWERVDATVGEMLISRSVLR